MHDDSCFVEEGFSSSSGPNRVSTETTASAQDKKPASKPKKKKGKAAPQEFVSCMMCTVDNKATAKKCKLCAAPLPAKGPEKKRQTMDSLTGVGSVPSPKSKKTRKAKVSVDPAPLEPTTPEDEVPAVMDEDFPAEM